MLPVGTSDVAVLSKQLQFVYEEPFRRLIEGEAEMFRLFDEHLTLTTHPRAIHGT